MFLQKEFSGRKKLASFTRTILDILWGVPSIVYGAFILIIMIYAGMRACLLGGIMALTLIEIPIMTRTMDETIRMVPSELKEASYSLGATRLETTRIVSKQALPGIISAVLLALGRGIGDGASILLVAGFTDHIPSSLFDPVASLPLAVLFQLGTPFLKVQQRAYASALILLLIVLLISIISRLLARKFEKYVIK
jgi:phosphate transport system permease protein